MRQYPIVFSSKVKFIEGVVSVSPNEAWRSYNDFGYRFRAIATLILDDERYRFDIYIVPRGNCYQIASIFDYVSVMQNAQGDIPFLAEENGGSLVSLLADPADYSKAYECMGKSAFLTFMQSICDIGYLKWELGERFVENEITKDERVHLGILRLDSVYRSYWFGFSCAANVTTPVDAKIPLNISVALDGFENDHYISLKYVNSDIVDDRIHAFVGVNGSGKTRCLAALVSGLCQRTNYEVAHNRRSRLLSGSFPSKYHPVSSRIPLPLIQVEDLPVLPSVMVYSCDTDSRFPRSVSPFGAFSYQYANLHDIQTRPAHSDVRLLVNILRDEELLNGKNTRATILRTSLESILPLEQLVLPMKESIPSHRTFEDKYGHSWVYVDSIRGELKTLQLYANIDYDRKLAFYMDEEVRPLSSGENAMFRSCLHLVSFIKAGSLIILDEPETHLHPNWITLFIRFLYHVLSATKSIAIIATHSAYVVRELPTHCNHIFRLVGDRKIEISHVYERTLGASVSAISEYVFGDSLVDAYHDEITKKLARSGQTFDEIVEEYGELLNIDLLSSIRRKMVRR